MRAKRGELKHSLWAVLPVRGIAQGKSRLAPALDRAERARLNRWLLGHTLDIVAAWLGGLSRCIVVSSCAQTLRIAEQAHALALTEPRPRRGLDSTVSYAIGMARRSGAGSVLVLPSDLPLLSVAALDALIERMVLGYAVVIAPDAARTGTNALLLNVRGRFDFRYGSESYVRHVQAARTQGWKLSTCTHPQLALDVDLPRDLALWRERSKRCAGRWYISPRLRHRRVRA